MPLSQPSCLSMTVRSRPNSFAWIKLAKVHATSKLELTISVPVGRKLPQILDRASNSDRFDLRRIGSVSADEARWAGRSLCPTFLSVAQSGNDKNVLSRRVRTGQPGACMLQRNEESVRFVGQPSLIDPVSAGENHQGHRAWLRIAGSVTVRAH
jgi:hypothetical protein